jgi:hypothetical protein
MLSAGPDADRFSPPHNIRMKSATEPQWMLAGGWDRRARPASVVRRMMVGESISSLSMITRPTAWTNDHRMTVDTKRKTGGRHNVRVLRADVDCRQALPRENALDLGEEQIVVDRLAQNGT